MHRYGPAYEAAALYCVTSRNNTGKATKSRKRGEDDEPDMEQRMDLHELAEASTEFTYLELKQVLPHVMETVDKMDQGNSKGNQDESVQSKKNPAASSATTASM